MSAVAVTLAQSQSSPKSVELLWGAAEGEGLGLVGRVIKVEWADESTDSASVEDGVKVVEGALAEALDGEGELLAEAGEDEGEAFVGFGMACFVSTIVMETETVVASGSSTSVDFVT
jgi:hypothetical protein